MKPITLEELSKEKKQVPARGKGLKYRCPGTCPEMGYYDRCFLDTYVLCPIFYQKYERLTPDQRKTLLS